MLLQQMPSQTETGWDDVGRGRLSLSSAHGVSADPMKMQILTQQVWCGPQSLPLTSSQVMLIVLAQGAHSE